MRQQNNFSYDDLCSSTEHSLERTCPSNKDGDPITVRCIERWFSGFNCIGVKAGTTGPGTGNGFKGRGLTVLRFENLIHLTFGTPALSGTVPGMLQQLRSCSVENMNTTRSCKP